MNLKKRLLLANAAIIAIPLGITLVAAVVALVVLRLLGNGISLTVKDGSPGGMFLLLPDKLDAASLTGLVCVLGGVFLGVLALTNFLVSYQLSRRMIQPLQALQQAAGEISRGNLDQPIVEAGDEEIRALCRDLERMRLKLKESVYTQLRFEDNRKVLITSISHDLKTPITSIRGHVEGIMDGVAHTPEKIASYLQTIGLKVRQIDQMIDDLLLYAKLDLKQIPFDFEMTDLVEYAGQCVADNAPELARAGIQLTFGSNVSGAEPVERAPVYLDRARMQRVVMNILDNSRKYLEGCPGEIQISLRATPTSFIMELHDNGPGIPAQDLPRIFDRFYRNDTARTQGNGLGLAIAKTIVEGHQGRIWALSHPSEGASILIALRKA
ncbi:MAG: HAMP domain-containing histidine kinase [Peptococcaceae bacterium]|jgi:signal transduction histidine kinase|nr:HAMP domain-containing histidine kinase [Peptococcaceae bacterium]